MPNNCFNLTCPLSRFVHLASLVHAQTAPIRFAERAAQVKQMCAPGMAHDLQGESPCLTTCQEEGLVKDNGVVARRGRKEVWNKTRTRRTETAYEAQALDKAARHVNVQSLNGRRLCKCSG